MPDGPSCPCLQLSLKHPGIIIHLHTILYPTKTKCVLDLSLSLTKDRSSREEWHAPELALHFHQKCQILVFYCIPRAWIKSLKWKARMMSKVPSNTEILWCCISLWKCSLNLHWWNLNIFLKHKHFISHQKSLLKAVKEGKGLSVMSHTWLLVEI